MALRVDWSSLDHQPFHVLKGDGFVINSYGHPSFIRYIEGHHLLTLSYEYVDETAQRGRRYFIFRNYTIQVEVPTKLTWDNGTEITESEARTVLDRVCRTLAQHKRRHCVIVINDRLYEQLAAAQQKRKEAQRPSG